MAEEEELQDLAAALASPKGVHTLDLSGQELDSLPADVGRLTQVTELDVGGTRLVRLPAEIGKMKALERLLVSSTPLEGLPSEIGGLHRLKHVELGRTRVRTLPDEIGKLGALEFLDVSGSPLESLPESVGDCRSLRWLRLGNTSLTSVPDTLAQCTNLALLDLQGTTFSAEGGERVADLIATLKKEGKLAVVRWPRMPGVATRSAGDKLGANVVDAIVQLGGVLRTELPKDAPTTVKAMGGSHPLPVAYRRFMFGVEWPADVSFSAELPDGIDVWDLRFGVWGELEEYACSRTRPYVSIGEWDGGNYQVVVALDDITPDDPAVYRLDHDEFEREAPAPTGLQLSGFLACLEGDGDENEEVDEDE